MTAEGQFLHGESGSTLETGELTLVGRLTSASNATFLAEAHLGGRVMRCIYKPVRGEQPLWDFPDGTLAGREVASYLIAVELGWPLIPQTVLRDGPFGPGMVQRWVRTPENRYLDEPADEEVEAVEPVVDVVPAGKTPQGWRQVLRAQDGDGQLVSLIHADDPRLLQLAVLDVLLNNADRKGGHVLTGLDGRLYGIDHGICLHRENKLRTVLWGWAGTVVPDALLEDMRRFATALAGPFGVVLSELVTAAEVKALGARVAALVEAGVMPVPSGRNPIPWPAF
jgi:uncharacterized repeat protein (TIGR03843 family)